MNGTGLKLTWHEWMRVCPASWVLGEELWQRFRRHEIKSYLRTEYDAQWAKLGRDRR